MHYQINDSDLESSLHRGKLHEESGNDPASGQPASPLYHPATFDLDAIGVNPGLYNGAASVAQAPDVDVIDGILAADFRALWCGLSWNEGNTNYNQAPIGTPMVLTYSFMTALPGYYTDPALLNDPLAARINVDMSGFMPFNSAQQDAVRAALALVAGATGLSFIEVPASAGGELSFGMHAFTGDKADKAGYAYLPYVDEGVPNADPLSLDNLSQQGVPGDVFLRAQLYQDDPLLPGSDGFGVLMHEIGHSLGLTHPDGAPALDSWDSSVMSQNRGIGAPPTSYRPVDLAILQYLYGSEAQEQALATLIVRNFDAVNNVLSTDGSALDDILIGTDLRDLMQAGAGADQLWGRGGDDVIDGGSGNDRLDGGVGNDVVNGGDGDDFVQGSWGSDTLSGGAGYDWLNGGFGSDVLIGTGDGDVLVGDSWSTGVFDTADYSAASGAVHAVLGTSMEWGDGGLNHDGTAGWFHVNGSAEVAGVGGGDTLVNINRLVGSAFGDVLSDSSILYQNDILVGGAGNDVLISHGGNDAVNSAGDVLTGGAGADRFMLSFAWGGQGNITVTDFNAAEGDRLVLQPWVTLARASALSDAAVLLTLSDGNTVTLTGLALADFHPWQLGH